MNIDKEVLKHIEKYLTCLHKVNYQKQISVEKEIKHLFNILLKLNVVSVVETQTNLFEIKVKDSESLFLKRDGDVNIFNEFCLVSYLFVKPIQVQKLVFEKVK